MSWNPEVNRQEAIELACQNAIRAMYHVQIAAEKERRFVNCREQLAAALEAIEIERTAPRRAVGGLSLPFNVQDCIDHLRGHGAATEG